jgi:hypothetical protein
MLGWGFLLSVPGASERIDEEFLVPGPGGRRGTVGGFQELRGVTYSGTCQQ